MTQKELTIPANIGKPAFTALNLAGIATLKQVAEMTDEELLAMHGVGPKAVRILREAIKQSKIK